MLFLKLLQQLFKTLNSDGTPTQVGAGIALGAVFGLTPLIELHNLFFFACALIVNVSFPAVMLGWVAFVPLGFALDPAFDAVGRNLLEAAALRPMWTTLANIPVVPLTNFNNTVVLGSLVIWALAFFPLLLLARYGVTKYRVQVYERLKRTRAFQAVTASKLYNLYTLFRPPE